MRRSVPPLHPDVTELAFLLGTWRGEGRGDYPTIEPFAYGEELTFDHVGDAFIGYAQRSWLLHDGSPLHAERGFVRPGRDGYELTIAHPLGLTEVAHGSLDGGALSFATGDGDVRRTATGMPVVALSRRYEWAGGDVLRYTLDMTTDATAHTRHLEAELRRVPGE